LPLLLDYIHGPLILDDGRVVPAWQVSQDDEAEVSAMLRALREGQLIGTARQGPFGKRQTVLPEVWCSIGVADVNWQLSSVPKHGLIAIRIEEAPSQERRRGPQPEVRRRVLEEMQRLVEVEGRDRLASMKQAEMKELFGAAESTCRLVRQEVLAGEVSSF
jgi:hypothetical protein